MAPPTIHNNSTFIAPVLVAIAVCSPGFEVEVAVPLPLTPALPLGVAPATPAVTIATLVTVDFWPLGRVVVWTTRLEEREVLDVDAPEEEGPLEEDIVRAGPPTVLTIVTPAAFTVVTTEPSESVLRTVPPAALVVVRMAPAVRGGADDDGWALDEPGAEEPPSVVAVLALESG